MVVVAYEVLVNHGRTTSRNRQASLLCIADYRSRWAAITAEASVVVAPNDVTGISLVMLNRHRKWSDHHCENNNLKTRSRKV